MADMNTELGAPPPYSGPPPPYQPPQGPPHIGGPNAGAPIGFVVPTASPGGPSLYPDISQLPQPQAVTYGPGFDAPFVPPSEPPPPYSGPQLKPARPPPPVPTPAAHHDSSSVAIQRTHSPPLKDGEAPPGCVVSWKGGDGLKVYFIQQEGHIVSPHKPLALTVYKRIGGQPHAESGLLGMIEVGGCWRLKLREEPAFVLHTHPDTYVFLDTSTSPDRVVVLVLPADVTTTMLKDLLTLLTEMTNLKDEKEGVVDKISSGVNTVYSDLTRRINTTVKGIVPGAHANTKWIRKGAGSLLRFGGSLVAKGAHLVEGTVAPQQQEEDSPGHTHLMEALATFRKKLETDDITYV